MKHPARLAAVLVLSAGTVLVPTAAHAAAPATAAFTRLAQWPAGYVGSITVRNDTAATIDGWRVGFDLTGGTRVTSSHSAVFSHSGDRYTVTNESWNGRLAPGSSATFGWVAAGQGTPAGCTLNGASCTGTPPDFTAPVRPGPLAFDISKGLTVSWAPSAGDGEQVAYQVFESERLLATVTEPRYVYSSGGALPPRIYVFAVRAVDAAGVYVPGGRAAYPSSVLMNAIPAKVAGVERLVMVTPTPDGEVNPLVLAAAHLAGVDEIWCLGDPGIAGPAHDVDRRYPPRAIR
jgi:chitinase